VSQTAERSFRLVECVARAERPCGLVELASLAHLDKSTAARLLANLEERGLLRRDQASRRYSVGPVLVSLGAIVTRKADLPRIARPHLDSLRDESEETVSLHIRAGDERVCVAGAESRHVVQRVLAIGEPVALWEGPTGKVILAFLTGEDRAAVLRRAQAAGFSAHALAEPLSSAARDGWIISVGDRTPGVGALSAPLFEAAGVVGSITVAGPVERWSREKMTPFAGRLRAAAAEISGELGGRVP
jgi:IclR family acetate operon transcriptional repressor